MLKSKWSYSIVFHFFVTGWSKIDQLLWKNVIFGINEIVTEHWKNYSFLKIKQREYLLSRRLDFVDRFSAATDAASLGSQRGSEEKTEVFFPWCRLLLVSSRSNLTASFPVNSGRETAEDRRRRFFRYCSKFWLVGKKLYDIAR